MYSISTGIGNIQCGYWNYMGTPQLSCKMITVVKTGSKNKVAFASVF